MDDPLDELPLDDVIHEVAGGALLPDPATRHVHERTADGKLLMTWRNPDWVLKDLPTDLQLSSFEPLEALQGRQQCPGCGKSQHYLCFNCLRPFATPTPQLSLPFRLHLVFHRNERRSMSTGIHAAVLAPEKVTVHSWSDASRGSLKAVHGGEDRPVSSHQQAVVLFPSPEAVELGSLDLEQVTDVVVVESKWQGSQAILSLPEVAQLPRVKLQPQTPTCFWRYHTKGLTQDCVSTIEAILWLCREWHAAKGMHERQPRQCHCFDNLLWYFAFYHGLILREG